MTITVVAALIFRADRILICQRRAADALGLKWEFPGGKVKPGESLKEALARELKEELGVASQIGAEVHATTFAYRDLGRTVALHFFRAQVSEGTELQNLVFERIQWEQLERLLAYDFLPADRELVELLATRRIPLEHS